jgi:hypothetical protein
MKPLNLDASSTLFLSVSTCTDKRFIYSFLILLCECNDSINSFCFGDNGEYVGDVLLSLSFLLATVILRTAGEFLLDNELSRDTELRLFTEGDKVILLIGRDSFTAAPPFAVLFLFQNPSIDSIKSVEGKNLITDEEFVDIFSFCVFSGVS